MLKLKLSYLFAVVFGAFLITSCNNKVNQEGVTPFNDEHTAQNSLDWNGQYFGTLPCADCQGIETILTLNTDGSYQLTSKYLTDKPSIIDTVQGKFTWEGNNIKLDGIKEGEGSPYFKIEENRVKFLDLEGKEIEGALSASYILRKMGNDMVEGKTWKLVELNGKPVNGSAETHYLILDNATNRAQAKANCNIINMGYKIIDQYAIHFEEGMSTLMACPDNLEDEFVKVLSTVDNLSTDGNRLTLNKGRMAPLAVFELAE
ncbi:MAG: copper resistance protein NlpE N-terminal domain-containing protein [Chitinophagales bacterium]|nr:copper resistance protein NlpE N-terminal domain-containing protein [Chitinophagales bacterium]